MMNIAGLGRLAAATIVLSGLAFGSAVKAQEVSEEQLPAEARPGPLGFTCLFGDLPGLGVIGHADLLPRSSRPPTQE